MKREYYLLLTNLNVVERNSDMYSWQLEKDNIIEAVCSGNQMFVSRSMNGTFSQFTSFHQDLIKAYIKHNRPEIKKL
jgi:hypothetical protein